MIAEPQQEKTVPVPELSQAPQGLMQRKCGCSGSSGGGGCSECKNKKLQPYENNRTTLIGAGSYLETLASSQRKAMPETSSKVFGHNFGLVSPFPGRRLQKKSLASDASDRYEEEADRVAEQIVHAAGGSNPKSNDVSPSGPVVQRAAADGGGSSGDGTSAAAAAGPTSQTAAAVAEPATPGEATGGGLIVEDDATEVAPGQMRKTEFLDALRSNVCAAADAELAAVGRSTAGCPYVERWISHYRTRPAQHVERALRRYAPDAAGVSSASGYIPLVAARVRRAVTVWATTGQITGVPEELAAELTGGGVLGALGGGIAAVASAAAGVFGGIGSAIGGLFTKAKAGGARAADDPQEIQSQLSSGQSLEGNVKSRMENAFGHDFSRVRVHSDSNAAGLSASVNARAFTIGHDVAFGAGEYQPNTLIGDALIAHELAHVVQQGSAAPGVGPQMQGGDYNGLEEDADRAAVSAVVSSWGGGKAGLAGISEHAMPQLRSGLRLSRCSRGGNSGEHACTTQTTASTPVKNVTVRHTHLFGGLRPADFTSHLAYANRVYSIAGINFVAGNELDIDETNTKDAALLGTDANLDVSADPPRSPSYTAEETALMGQNHAGGELTAYYLQDMLNVDLWGLVYIDSDSVALESGVVDRVLAHEMGHVLMGLGHPNNNDNIMAQTSKATRVDCLSDDQIAAARGHHLAQ